MLDKFYSFLYIKRSIYIHPLYGEQFSFIEVLSWLAHKLRNLYLCRDRIRKQPDEQPFDLIRRDVR